MEYNPKDAEICWPVGTYPATLIKVEERTSKLKPGGGGGNPMQVWTFKAYHEDGQEQLISDYVVVPGATFKIKQLALALDRKDEFESGTFQADDHVNADVDLELAIESSAGFADKNKVKKIKATVPTESQRQESPARQAAAPGVEQRAANLRGMRPTQRPPASAPFGDEQLVPDEDIPFRHCDHRTPV